MALLMAVAIAFATVGSVRVARHRVHSAADLSALGAAQLVIADPDRACARARELARDNGAALVRCTITGEVVDVWTSLTISVPGVGQRNVLGRARAGPARIDPGPPAPSADPALPAPAGPALPAPADLTLPARADLGAPLPGEEPRSPP